MTDQTDKPEWQTKEYWAELFGTQRDERIDEETRNILQIVYWLNIAMFVAVAVYYLITGFTRPITWLTIAVTVLSLGQFWWLIGRHQIEEVDEYSSYIKRRPYLFIVGTMIWFPLAALVFYLIDVDTYLTDYLIWTAITVVGWTATPVLQLVRGLFPRRTVIFTVVLALISGLGGFLLAFYETMPDWMMSIFIGFIFLLCGWFGYRQYKKRPW